MLIHGEAIPGDRQFWLTRPYNRASLFGAKLVFVGVVVILPRVISDCVLLSAKGLLIHDNLNELLFRHLLNCVLLLLPMVVVAVLTANMGHASLIGIIGAYAVIGIQADYSNVIPNLIVIFFFGIILLLQYRWRATTPSYACFVLALILSRSYFNDPETSLRLAVALSPPAPIQPILALTKRNARIDRASEMPGWLRIGAWLVVREPIPSAQYSWEVEKLLFEVDGISTEMFEAQRVTEDPNQLAILGYVKANPTGKSSLKLGGRAYLTLVAVSPEHRVPLLSENYFSDLGKCTTVKEYDFVSMRCVRPVWGRFNEGFSLVGKTDQGKAYPLLTTSHRMWGPNSFLLLSPVALNPDSRSVSFDPSDDLKNKEVVLRVAKPVTFVRVDLDTMELPFDRYLLN